METILIEAENSADSDTLAALLRSAGIPFRRADPPIRRGDTTISNRGLPPLWADRPSDLAVTLRREAWERK